MNSCSRCGAELRLSSAGKLCVRCLLESGINPPSPEPPSQPAAGSRFFGEYELLEEIARGGMGVIYRALQPGLGRIVALKMILAGQFASKHIVQRFRGEVAAAAVLRHPNIVAIHDVGIHDDQHYFCMDFVEGQNLSQLVGNRPLTPAKAARYLEIIAEAIQYAHSQGILHRDLKPSNILVDAATDQPRLTDFGLAKRLDGDSSITVTGQVLGSPNFMPPEQADSRRGKVGRSSDVYGLGAILYYLLTARPPFQSESFEDLIRQLLEVEPVSPRSFNSAVTPDLETICLKCLQKEPSRRYQSAQELADELRRFLHHEPIRARPITAIERGWRWSRRKPALAALIAALALVFALGFAGTLWQWRHAVRNATAEAEQRKLAVESRERADQNVYDSDMRLVQYTWDEGDLGGALGLLEAHRPKSGASKDRRGFEWFYYWNLCRGDPHITLGGHSNDVTCVLFSPDGKRMATGSPGTPVQVFDVAGNQLFRTLPESNVVSLAFSPDSKMLAIGGRDHLNVWELDSAPSVFNLEESLADYRIAFLSDGRHLAVGKRAGLRRFGQNGGSTELWDFRTRHLEHAFPNAGGCIAVSPRGDRLATGNVDDSIIIWDLKTLAQIITLKTGGATTWLFSPDGETLITNEGHPTFWNIASGKKIASLANGDNASTFTVSSDGRFLATGGADQTVTIWDMATYRPLERFIGHRSEVASVDLSVDGQTVISGSKDGSAMIWTFHAHAPITTVSNVVSRPIFSPDGQYIAAGVDSGKVELWDSAAFKLRAVFPGARDAVAFSEDGAFLSTRSANEFLKTFGTGTQLQVGTSLPKPVAETNDHTVLSPDRRVAALGLSDGTLTFLDPRTGALLGQYPRVFSGNIFQLSFSPNGKFLAVAGRESEAGRRPAAKIFDVATHRQLAVLIGHAEVVLGASFAPDGQILATCGADNSIRFWDTTTWKEIPPALNQKGTITSVAFSPLGKTLASSSFDGTLRFWNVATHRKLTSIKVDAMPQFITFSPDGQTLAMLTWTRLVRVWRAPTGIEKQARPK